MTSTEIAYLAALVLLIVVAVATVAIRNVFAAVVTLSIFSLITAVLFAFMQAVDVSLAEAVIGAGLSTAFFMGAVAATRGE